MQLAPMRLAPGLTALVTGAGSGIGRGLAQELAARGLAVGVADIRAEAAEETAASLRAAGGRALALAVDVSDARAVAAAVAEVEAALGPVDLMCNNAGVAMHGLPLHEIAPADWDWAIGVNVYGVIHGIRAVLPAMLARGRGHVLNTASIGGYQVNPDFLTAAYSMTKYAVVALSEGLRNEVSDKGIGVSVLAPAAVETGIHMSARARPDRLGGPGERPQNHFLGDLLKGGAEPRAIARMAMDGIEAGRFHIFTHPETEIWIEKRHAAIRADFAAARAGAARDAAE